MQMYAVWSQEAINSLDANTKDVAQVWFADDSIVAAKLANLYDWWVHLNRIGPMYGYFPHAPKTVLMLKSPKDVQRARDMFGPHVKITTDGKRYVGEAIGTKQFKQKYIQEKVNKWLQDVNELAKIAEEEPQAALSAFNTGLSHRWTFVQRTMPGISALFQPLEDAIRQRLIPDLCGRPISDLERRLLALPYRCPVETADHAYATSVRITEPPAELIVNQNMDLCELDRNAGRAIKSEIVMETERAQAACREEIAAALDAKSRCLLDCAQEKGASS